MYIAALSAFDRAVMLSAPALIWLLYVVLYAVEFHPHFTHPAACCWDALAVGYACIGLSSVWKMGPPESP